MDKSSRAHPWTRLLPTIPIYSDEDRSGTMRTRSSHGDKTVGTGVTADCFTGVGPSQSDHPGCV